jgi:hypothetical protein
MESGQEPIVVAESRARRKLGVGEINPEEYFAEIKREAAALTQDHLTRARELAQEQHQLEHPPINQRFVTLVRKIGNYVIDGFNPYGSSNERDQT